MRRVLVVAYRFPPQAGAGSLRISKFVKYLPEFGWHPEVLTVGNPLGDQRDESLLAAIPRDVIVHRVDAFYWRRVESALLGRTHGVRTRRPDTSNSALPPAVTDERSPSAGTRLGHLYRALRDLIEFPDVHIGWVPPAAYASARLCRGRSFDAIFCSTPPHSAQLAAYLAAKFSGVPLVVDLRDPWSDLFHLARRPWRRAAVRFLERLVFRQASAVVLNTDAMMEMVRSHHPKFMPRLFHAIPNGYDSADFEARDTRGDASEVEKIILHVGAVYQGLGDPTEILRGLETVVARNPSLRSRVRLRFIGAGPILRSGPYGRLLRDSPLRERIDIVDHQPHRVCVEAMRDASVLFLVQNSPDTPTQVSSKLYEYLYARRPVLAITTSIATREVVERTGCGRALQPGRPEEVANVLESFLTQESTSFAPLANAAQAYERRELTRRLAEVLEAVAGQDRGRR